MKKFPALEISDLKRQRALPPLHHFLSPVPFNSHCSFNIPSSFTQGTVLYSDEPSSRRSNRSDEHSGGLSQKNKFRRPSVAGIRLMQQVELHRHPNLDFHQNKSNHQAQYTRCGAGNRTSYHKLGIASLRHHPVFLNQHSQFVGGDHFPQIGLIFVQCGSVHLVVLRLEVPFGGGDHDGGGDKHREEKQHRRGGEKFFVERNPIPQVLVAHRA